MADAQSNDEKIGQVIGNVNDTLDGFTDNIGKLTVVIQEAIDGISGSVGGSGNIDAKMQELEVILKDINIMIENVNQVLSK